jgi:DNA transformation protein
VAASGEFQDFLKEQLVAFGEVSVRRMFGGAGIFRDGVMFAIIDGDDALYLKADETTRAAFLEEGCGPFVYERGGKAVSLSYYRLPERLYDDAAGLCEWARDAHSAALRNAGPKRSRKAT